jgi:hypothetical protein
MRCPKVVMLERKNQEGNQSKSEESIKAQKYADLQKFL